MLQSIEDLEKSLSKLPGFGRKSAARAALSLVKEPDRLLRPLVRALVAAERDVKLCSLCGSFTDAHSDPCAVCVNPLRDRTFICVVEDPSDIVSIESSGAFNGLYHSLGGKISPLHKKGPDKIRIAELIERVEREGVKEVLLALSTDMDGDATASYIAELLKSSSVKVTRLAFGLPADSGIAYSDPLTLKRAVFGRMGV
jgi:recombination protein RecR